MVEEFDERTLAAWLSTRIGADAVDIEVEGRPAGGFSAETTILSAMVTRGGDRTGERFVLRREAPEPAVYPAQSDLDLPEIEIQFRIMEALARTTATPLAPLVGHEPDSTVLGTPFFVMGFVEGVVPIESPPYTAEGFFVDATPAQRTEMISSGLEALARLHSIDQSSLGLDWLAPAGVEPGGQHLLDLWRSFGDEELRGRSHPALERAWSWLDTELPADSGIGLCWGDPRPGNIIWEDFRPACLTDFEAACIGPPEFDLAWWLMFDRTMHDLVGIERLPGDPDRDEQRRIYFDRAGLTPFETFAHEVFAAARYSVIVVRVMNRLEQRGLLGPESSVWLENPASACLQVYLEEIS